MTYDIYTKLSKELGISRPQVKTEALWLTYSNQCPNCPGKFEEKLREILRIKFYKIKKGKK